jgi:hypothetical protein
MIPDHCALLSIPRKTCANTHQSAGSCGFCLHHCSYLSNDCAPLCVCSAVFLRQRRRSTGCGDIDARAAAGCHAVARIWLALRKYSADAAFPVQFGPVIVLRSPRMSGSGTTRTRRKVCAPVAIEGKADLQQRASNLRRRFTPPRQGEPKLTRGSASATVVALVVRACQFRRSRRGICQWLRSEHSATRSQHAFPSAIC